MTQELTSAGSAFAIDRTTGVVSICIAEKVKSRIMGIAKTKRRSSFDITEDSFDSGKMRLLGISLVSSTHTFGKHDVRSARSEVEQGTNHATIV